MRNLNFYLFCFITCVTFSCQSDFEEFDIPTNQAYSTTASNTNNNSQSSYMYVSYCTLSSQVCVTAGNEIKNDCAPTGEGCTVNQCSGGTEDDSRMFTTDINAAIHHASTNGYAAVVGRLTLDQSTATNAVVLELLVGAPEVEAHAATLAGTSAFDSYTISADYPLPANVCAVLGASNLVMKRGTYAVTDRTQSGYYNGKVSVGQ